MSRLSTGNENDICEFKLGESLVGDRGRWDQSSSFYRVRGSGCNSCSQLLVRSCIALTHFVLWGMPLGYLGTFKYVFILVTQDPRRVGNSQPQWFIDLWSFAGQISVGFLIFGFGVWPVVHESTWRLRHVFVRFLGLCTKGSGHSALRKILWNLFASCNPVGFNVGQFICVQETKKYVIDITLEQCDIKLESRRLKGDIWHIQQDNVDNFS